MTRIRSIEYHAVVYSADANGGPGTPKLDLTPSMLNLAWQANMNLPGKAAFTLVRGNPVLDQLTWMQDHIKVFRDSAIGLKTVFAGKLIKPSYSGGDAVCYAWDYLSFLQRSRSGYSTAYPTKMVGSEIVSPEWAAAKAATNSPFAFVATGTIEDPLGQDGITPIKTNAQFGLNLFNRLFTFYNLAEMAMANTSNNVVFEITRDAPHTFNFWKNRSASRTNYAFSYPGNLLPDHSYDQAWDQYVNDIASVVTDATTGAASEYDATTADVATSPYRRLQDAVTVQTIMGVTSGTTETDQLKAAVQHQLEVRTRLTQNTLLTPRQGEYHPFDGHDLGDTFRVMLANSGRTGALVDAYMRLTGIAAAWSPTHGEVVQLGVRAIP